MFWSKNKKKYVYPCIPQFFYIKWGLRGYTFHGHVFLMVKFLLFNIYFHIIAHVSILNRNAHALKASENNTFSVYFFILRGLFRILENQYTWYAYFFILQGLFRIHENQYTWSAYFFILQGLFRILENKYTCSAAMII